MIKVLDHIGPNSYVFRKRIIHFSLFFHYAQLFGILGKIKQEIWLIWEIMIIESSFVSKPVESAMMQSWNQARVLNVPKLLQP